MLGKGQRPFYHASDLHCVSKPSSDLGKRGDGTGKERELEAEEM